MTLDKQLQEIIDETNMRLKGHYAWFECGHNVKICEEEKYLIEHIALARALKEAVSCLKNNAEHCIFTQCFATCSNAINEIKKIMGKNE